jgi:hypothetical protein
MEMDYKTKLIELATNTMTEKGFDLLLFIEERLPDIWDRPSSSTGKYHQKQDGTVPSIAEHTYSMTHAASKIVKMFGFKDKSVENDVFMMSIILHDALKYGPKGTNPHTTKDHDRAMSSLLESNKKLLLKHFTEDGVDALIEGIRFHSGRWSASVPNKNTFDFKDYHPIVMFTHILDMLDTQSCLKYPEVGYDDLPF